MGGNNYSNRSASTSSLAMSILAPKHLQIYNHQLAIVFQNLELLIHQKLSVEISSPPKVWLSDT